MFCGCSGRRCVHAEEMNTEYAATVEGMLSGWMKVEDVDLNTFECENMECFKNMLNGCPSLIHVVLPFSTFSVTTFKGMFQDYPSLQELDLNSFEAEIINTYENMFSGWTSLSFLIIERFKVSVRFEVTNVFSECSNL